MRARVKLLGVIGVVALPAMLLLSPLVLAKSPLGKKWPNTQLVSMDQVDHSPFNALLKKHVDADGYVDYQAWSRSTTDRKVLQTYLTNLSQASRKSPASREAKLAFWINAYNAVTLEGIMQEYPTDSIRNHTAKVFGYNIWKELPLKVGNGQYSLEEIEHSILRKMNEPRIHFAIVCASVGCPRLLNEAYNAENIEQQLSANSRDFFARSNNFRVKGTTMHVSSILSWFGGDFGSTQLKRFTYLKPYLPKSAQTLAVSPNTTVRFLDYDWSLNDQSKKK